MPNQLCINFHTYPEKYSLVNTCEHLLLDHRHLNKILGPFQHLLIFQLQLLLFWFEHQSYELQHYTHQQYIHFQIHQPQLHLDILIVHLLLNHHHQNSLVILFQRSLLLFLFQHQLYEFY